MIEWEIFDSATLEHKGWVVSSNKYARALEIARDYQGDSVDVRLVSGVERKYDDVIDYVNHLRSECIENGGVWTRERDAATIYRLTHDCVEV